MGPENLAHPLAIVIILAFSRCVIANYIPCAGSAAGQVCPQGQCCGVNGYCGAGPGYCGQGNCLSQCLPNSAPPPPYYTGGNIADLEYHHDHNLPRVWRIVGIVAAIVAVVLLGVVLIVLLVK